MDCLPELVTQELRHDCVKQALGLTLLRRRNIKEELNEMITSFGNYYAHRKGLKDTKEMEKRQDGVCISQHVYANPCTL